MLNNFDMLRYKILWILLSALSLAACIDEDKDDCGPTPTKDNLSIKFDYIYKKEELLKEKIHKIDVFVFDEKGRFVKSQQVDSLALNNSSGTGIILEPGNYRIICWGNVSNKSAFSAFNSGTLFDNLFLTNVPISTRVAEGLRSRNGDLLYFAPNNVINDLSDIPLTKVSQESITNDTIYFHSAHAQINVYVKGLEDRGTDGNNLAPTIELTEIPQEYNFKMQSTGKVITYSDQSTYQVIAGERIAAKTFYTPVLRNQNPIQIKIRKSSDNSILTTISLEKFLKENNLSVEGAEQQIISILIGFKQTSVEITLPGWQEEPVQPDL